MNSKDNNIFKGFKVSQFKKTPPPKNDSETTKKELEYIGNINLDKRFFQEKDDILGNFIKFLDNKNLKYDSKFLTKLVKDSINVIIELKEFYKRPRPFKLDKKFNDPLLKSTKGYAYPSGHSTQSNLLRLVLSKQFPKYKKDFEKIAKDIVYSRQMAKAHYPSDIKFGEKLAKSMFEYLKDNNHIKDSLKETIKRVLDETIVESNMIKVSTLFKRKLNVVDQVIDKLIDTMYPCDFNDENEFLEGVMHDLFWLAKSKEFGIDDVEWLDIYDYIMVFKDENTGKSKKDEILEYYTERC
jgi:hypothetical protein